MKSFKSICILCCIVVLNGPNASAALLGIERDGNLYNISTVDASLSLIGNTGVYLGSLGLAQDGSIYGFSVGDDAALYTINPLTADATAIGPLNAGFVFEGALAYAPDGTAYGTTQGGAINPSLFTIDLNTGAATIIGLISGGDHDINGLAWRSDGVLVGLDRVSNSLLAIDPVTAVSSVIASVNPVVGAVGGMAVDGDTAYFSTSGPDSSVPGSNELYEFDLFSGAHSLVGSFSPTITGVGIAGLSQIPEPTSVVLIALMGGSVAWLRRFFI